MSSKEKKVRKQWSVEEDPFQFHAKPKDLVALSQDSIFTRPREEKEDTEGQIVVKPATTSTSVFSKKSFSSYALHPRLISILEKAPKDGGMGMNTSTAVQSAIIPLQLKQRRNVLIKSQTGSGKTLAFLVPIVNDLMSLTPAVTRTGGSRALIIAPTRELCVQITDVLDKITQCCVSIVGGCITGGEKKKSEKARLRKGVVVLVATPGRLLDHLKSTESFNLKQLRWVILDEADRLLDMGFEQTILEILSIIRGENLPGLKAQALESLQRRKEAQKNTLAQRWSVQNAVQAKTCAASDELVYIMASATLTTGVKQLAMPIMVDRGFTVIDTSSGAGYRSGAVGASSGNDENENDDDVINANVGIYFIKNMNDLNNVGKDMGRLDGSNNNVQPSDDSDDDSDSSDDSDDNDGEEGKKKKTTKNKKARLAATFDKGESIETPTQLSQYYMTVTCKWRLAALLSFLRTHAHQKVVVFFATCDSVDYHSLILREMLWPENLDPALSESSSADGGSGGGESVASAANKVAQQYFDETTGSSSSSAGGDEGGAHSYVGSLSPNANQFLEPLDSTFTGVFGSRCAMYRLHGNVPQRVRQSVYRDFCAAKSGILLCTDVAARGLDLPRVDWILQYDPPCETADYVHRIGRTARKGLAGSALMFLLPSEAPYVALLASHNLRTEQLALTSLLEDTCKFIPGAKKFKNTEEMAAVILQRRVESVVYHSRWLLAAGRQAFRSFVRAYATHSSDTKGIFSVQSLHLGHVAKSFGLRDSPKTLRGGEDVIGKIFNGAFSEKLYLQKMQQHSEHLERAASTSGKSAKQLKKMERDKKYSLSANANIKRTKGDKAGSSGGGGLNSSMSMEAAALALAAAGTTQSSFSGSRSSNVAKDYVYSPGTSVVKSGRERQKLRKVGSKRDRASSIDSNGGAGGKGGGGGGGGSSSSSIKPSGNFRKAGGTGYFRKKLRTQASSEFAAN